MIDPFKTCMLGCSPFILRVLSRDYTGGTRIPIQDCYKKGEHPNMHGSILWLELERVVPAP